MTFDQDGKRLDDEVVRKATEFMWTTIDEAFVYSTQNKDAISPDRSLLDFFREKLEQTDFTADEKRICLESCKLWGAYVGDPVSRQSLKFFHLEECIDGINLFLASTYNRILDHVARPALQHAQIHLKEPVVRTNATPRLTNDEHHEVTVTTDTGVEYAFDEVVVTCPLGWLKRNKAVFHPPLPPRLEAAIDNISYGRLEKVYVTFREAFWMAPRSHSTPTSMTSVECDETFPPFVQFLEANYVKDKPCSSTAGDADMEWNQECLSLASFHSTNNTAHPTLLFYTYGPCSTYIVSRLKDLSSSTSTSTPTSYSLSSPTQNKDHFTFLNSFLKPFYSRLPGYNHSSSKEPLSILATTWQNDPWAGNGSYCNFQTGMERADEDVEVLQGMGTMGGIGIGEERGVWFAGEHTAPFVALGTTTGAYMSGERVAGRIVERYGLKEPGVGEDDD